MDHEAMYTVVLRGKAFNLTQSQIEFDSPNYFTRCFLGKIQARRLDLSRDPDLFEIILDYLCGYDVFPLSEILIPERMSFAAALKNLRVDAEFYELNGLVRACDEYSSNIHRDPYSWTRYLSLLGVANYHSGVEPASLFRANVHTFCAAPIAPEQLGKGPFQNLTRTGLPSAARVDFTGLRVVSAIEGILAYVLGEDHHSKWRLLAWGMTPDGRGYRYNYQLAILVERRGVVGNASRE